MAKVKILLVQSYLKKQDLKVYPLGLIRIASSATEHDIRICDLNLYEDPYAKIEAELLDFDPDVVGISLRNIDNQNRIKPVYYYEDFTATIKKIKEIKPDTRLIAGGMGFSMFAREIMERNPELDLGVYLEGDETFGELLRNLDTPDYVEGVYFRRGGEVKFTGPRRPPDLNSLAPVQRDFVDMALYPSSVTSIGIESKRGCGFDCIYCNYPLLSGKKVRLRSPGTVVDEIERVVNEYGIDKFAFVDPIFNYPLDHATEICRGIIRRGLKVSWGGYMDIRYAPEDFLLLARDAGCTDFVFSPDGMSNNTLKSLNKGIVEDEIRNMYRQFRTNDKLKDAFVMFCLFLNPPGENVRGLLKTLWFYVSANCSLRGRGRVTVSWIRIEPGTEIHRIALATGFLKPDTDLLPNTSKGMQETFYSQPPLDRLNWLVLGIFKTIKGLKKLVAGVR